jgi:hypothetical protein
MVDSADLPYTLRHQDYEGVGYEKINLTKRYIPTLQNLAAWNLTRNQYLTETRELMKEAQIPVTNTLQRKDIKTLNNKIKNDITEKEQEEIDHPDLDELSENPRNIPLLRFLRAKTHSENIKNKLKSLSELTKTLSSEISLAYELLKPNWKAHTSLPDVLVSMKSAVKWILG